MKKSIILLLSVAFLMVSCKSGFTPRFKSEYNQIYKNADNNYKYEYAKECFANGKFARCTSILEDLVAYNKGTDRAEECLYMLAMAQYCDKDYESAAMTFRKYFSTYPRGKYSEEASYYVGQSLYMSTPEPRLDQTDTYLAIQAFQDYLDIHPDAKMKERTHDRLYELQDKLVLKALHNAQLYYDLGTYFGNCGPGENNYEACIITAQNALKDYPYSGRREDFSILVMKSKYELAQMSVESKQLERFQDAEDECYGFINEYPDSKEIARAEKYIAQCKKYTSKAQD